MGALFLMIEVPLYGIAYGRPQGPWALVFIGALRPTVGITTPIFSPRAYELQGVWQPDGAP